MKKQLIAAILCGLLISGLAGCGKQPKQPAESVPGSTVKANDTSGIDTSDVIPAEPTASEESEPPTESSASEPQQPAEKEKSEAEPVPQQTKTESQKPAEPTEPQQPQKPPAVQTQPTAPPESEPALAAPSQPTEPTVTDQPKEPEDAAPPAVTEPPKTFTQADHERIIKEVTAYAESYKAKGFIFEWKKSMEFGWDVGYFGTPRIDRDGVDGTIRTLKYHIDKIVSTSTDPANGITTEYMTYKVVQITIDGSIAYAVIYGG